MNQNRIELLQRINRLLVRGDIKGIAETTGFSRDYVGRVLSPFSNTFNEKVVSEAVKIVRIREQNTKKILETLPAVPL